MKQALTKRPGQIKGFFDNYKAPAIIALALLISFSGISQTADDTSQVRQKILAYGYDWNRGAFTKSLGLPKDSLKLKYADSGSVIYQGGSIWFWTGKKWNPVARKINDTLIQIGSDTLVVGGTGSGGATTFEQSIDNGNSFSKNNIVDLNTYDFIFLSGAFDLRDATGLYTPWTNSDPTGVEGDVIFRNSTSRFRGKAFTGWDNFVMDKQLRDSMAVFRLSKAVLDSMRNGLISDTVRWYRSHDSVYYCLKPFGGGAESCSFQYIDSTGGGGSGSGTVNIGAANRLAYYPSSGTTVDDLAAITANRALVSDTNGLPVHSATTATEIGYVNGVTGSIQTQLGTKQATLVSGTNIKTVNGASLLGSGNISTTGTDTADYEGFGIKYLRNAGGRTARVDTASGKIASSRALTDSMYKVLNNISMVSRIEFIKSGTDSTTYTDTDLVHKYIIAVFIEGQLISGLSRSTSIYYTFNTSTGKLTFTNGVITDEDHVLILYRTTPVFLTDGSGNYVVDGDGNYIITN